MTLAISRSVLKPVSSNDLMAIAHGADLAHDPGKLVLEVLSQDSLVVLCPRCVQRLQFFCLLHEILADLHGSR